MLRRKNPSDGGININRKSNNGNNGKSSRNNGDGARGRRSSGDDGSKHHHNHHRSTFPKSLIGMLIIGCGILLLVLISRLGTMRRTSSSESGIGTGTSIVRNENNLRINGYSKAKELSIGVADEQKKKTKKSRTTTTTTLSQLDPVGITSPATNATLHIVFSTDCGSFQHWQSYLFFHAALKVRQPGYVTRIASGCSDEGLKEEREWHRQHIQSIMSDRFRIHFTPHFSGVKDEETGEVKGDYKFFNKPFGLKHFLEYNELLGFVDDGRGDVDGDSSEREMKHPNDVIILTDPDFLLLRPITDDFSDERETLVGPRRKSIYKNKQSHIVSHGNPYAQTYGLGTQWRKFDLDAITGDPSSPAKDVDQPTGGIYYPAGPPYLATARDMYRIAVAWSDFAPRVHKQYPHLLAEMYAYCIAAAHLGMPHMLIDSLMVSSAGVGGEGWKFVKDIPAGEVCEFAASSNPNHGVHPVPSVIHYCQRYAVDRYSWGKRRVPHGIFTCGHPLLVEPPGDLGSGRYLSMIPNGRGEGQRKGMTAEKEKMEAFMVCALTRATNDAMVYFKTNHCQDGGNTKKAFDMWAGKEVVVSR